MPDQIGENIAVKAVSAGGVERTGGEAGGGVDKGDDVEVVVAGDDAGEGRVVRLISSQKISEAAVGFDVDAGIELL